MDKDYMIVHKSYVSENIRVYDQLLKWLKVILPRNAKDDPIPSQGSFFFILYARVKKLLDESNSYINHEHFKERIESHEQMLFDEMDG